MKIVDSSSEVNSNNCETNKDEANITGVIASKIKSDETNFEFDNELFEEIFENENVVEICIKKPRNLEKMLLTNQDLNHRNYSYSATTVVDSVKNIERSDVNLSVKKEDEIIIEKNELFDSEIFDELSSDCSDAPLKLAIGDNKNTVQCGTLERHFSDPIKSNTQRVCKTFTVPLIDCVQYPSNVTRSTEKHNLKKRQNARRVVNRNKNVNRKSISSASKPGLKTERNRTSKHDMKLKRKIIRCGECEFVTSQTDIMTVHMEKHIRYSEMGHKCQTCQLAFRNVNKLEEHINSCGTWSVPRGLPSEIIGLKPQKCTKCNFTTRLPQTYKRHMLAHSSLNAFKHDDDDSHDKHTECNICHKTLKSKRAVKLHIRRVHLKNFRCDICQKEFKRNLNLSRHMLIHKTIRKFKCGVCQKAFMNPRHLRKHMLVHSDNKPFICDICKKSFSYKSSLYLHTVCKHSGNGQYVCNICNKAFHFKSGLKFHMKVHSSKPEFKCHTCHKCFKGRVYLRTNLQSHSNSDFGCDVCDEMFKTINALRMHKRTHSARKKEFFCDICSRGYLTREALLKHIKLHHNVEKFVCDFCQKGFLARNNVRNHNKVHYYDKTFACSVCQLVFNRHYMLDKHVWESHRTGKNVKFEIDKLDNTSFVKRYNQSDQLNHSNDRTVFCEICEKNYKIKCRIRPNENNKRLKCAHCEYKAGRKVHLSRHILLKHTPDYDSNNFQCFNCGSSYKTKESLKKHLRKKHVSSYC